MKIIGLILIIAGIIWGIVAFNMDVSVKVESQTFGAGEYRFKTPEMKVNNMELMQRRQNHLFVAGFMIFIGVILFIAGVFRNKEKPKSENETVNTTPNLVDVDFDSKLGHIRDDVLKEKNFNSKVNLIKNALLAIYQKEGFNKILPLKDGLEIRHKNDDKIILISKKDEEIEVLLLDNGKKEVIDTFPS